jgi:transcriptional regulator
VVKGTLDLLVLKAVSERPLHGFEVTEWIEARTRGTVLFDDSAVYQALYRLEKRRHVRAEWGVTENNRRARYYALTRAGSNHLKAETTRLLRFAETMAEILTSPTQAG